MNVDYSKTTMWVCIFAFDRYTLGYLSKEQCCFKSNKNELPSKKLKQVKLSSFNKLFKIFTIVIFFLLILTYHFARFHKNPLSEKEEQGVPSFELNLVLKWLITESIEVNWTYSQFSPLFTYCPLSSCKISEKSIMWIGRARCKRFFNQFGKKMSQLGPKDFSKYWQ